MHDFAGRVAVVTGAASGIGRALALRFADEGMGLALADVESEPLDELRRELVSGGTRVLTRTVDVGDLDAMRTFASAVFDEFDGCHVLCNNAGVFAGGFLWDRTDSDLEWVLRVNLWGVLNGIRAFVPGMIERGEAGHVVNTSSVAGLFGSGYSGTYNISKFAAFAATESLANDLRAIGAPIGVSVLCPGATNTAIAKSGRNRPAVFESAVTEDAAFVEQMLADTVARGCDPSVVADAVVDGIRNDRFLILPTPSVREPYRARCEALLAGHLPGAMPTD
jgi:NAD(P)-dependent dehydrogenase (short-subunit alcohol dehydrogenase family)